MDRREFISGATSASSLLLLKSRTAFGYEANSAVRLGLLGCGNRGTTVATSFAKNTTARIVALADIFPDQLAKGKAHFDDVNRSLGIPPVDTKLMFRGYKAFEELAAASGVDAIQISTPPWFHVQHLEAVVAAGKHVYCEKPLGVDVAQAKQALEIGKRAEGRLSLDVGFQVRSAPPIAEIIRRIHAGHIGKIGSVAAHYNAPASKYPERPPMSADELRLRNWLWDRVLSGNILVEQNIHVIDLCNLILQAHPTKAVARGGRNIITHAGDTWDNYEVIYTYPGDVRVSFSSTQFGNNGFFDVSESIFGATGIAEAPYSGAVRIVGENAWTWSDPSAPSSGSQPATFAANGAFSDNLAHADSEKDKSFIASITDSKFHNQTADGVQSALSCMLGRMAAETGREVTWDEQLEHGEKYSLKIDMSQFT
ncbi:putative oxidoreductase [Acidisarcina polymorpha]|uniref:Putative oxidoreductase n=1 Tax=Acidisarcina polymorpha TaxID=2211140 RepID=A0A2Z5G0F3_9BACT|nr:Gfo/Idh/MocA family oxidoreductase [Acidisarcina polymorpha]AXC12519.1 putative oxidoreductase [Acidisarcina polymorpha]